MSTNKIITFTPIDRNGTTRSANIDVIPDKCPACDQGGTPVYHLSYFVSQETSETGAVIEVIYHCPFIKCNRLYIARYQKQIPRWSDGVYRLKSTYVLNLVDIEAFPDSIEKISKVFSQIYNQAKIAEENGLNQICGAGYRRALEFLVKDYLIGKFPDKKEQIIKKLLGEAIKMIDDSRIKKCAERATWLGNDETHYYRKWEEKDLNDLKILIKLTVNWMDSDMLSGEYEVSMKPEKKEVIKK